MIALGIKKKMSYREIGDSIGQDHSVVFREIERNGGRGNYWALRAQRWADQLTNPGNRATARGAAHSRAALLVNRTFRGAYNAGTFATPRVVRSR
ncbi:helix-turn-helix domain-containing protein [Amycolatopsis taiwanensis]|uniref:Transposase IS30-like HTH domain-containing protein n=1 Tax=Amycolatopsis taiwanensis TaxID=342230 RepID=A0A9W6QYL5_9PSEU|nr:hypothetical protein Atai01_15670 [Amycolatopsis taiwanensis]